MQPQLEALANLPPAAPVVFEAMAKGVMPSRRMKVSEWAEAHREVPAESGSRYPGEWRNERAPHLVDIMDALGPEDPAEDVVIQSSAQIGKSEVGINFFGYVVDQDPGPMLLVLPSHDESQKYVRTKLQPAIDATPRLKSRVLEQVNRQERGSTAAFKKFRGGFCQVTFAGSSKGLQMISARYTIGDEVSEWPSEAGERGDPVDQLKTRTEIFERDRKRLWTSTPALLGTCRVSAMYEASDKRQRYVPCPHCSTYQILDFDRLRWDSDSWPHHAWFECAAHGCVIEHVDKEDMMAKGEWIATAGEDEETPPIVFEPEDLDKWKSRHVPGRLKGFAIWAAYSMMTSWDSIVSKWLAAKDNHEKLRVFTQQTLGQPWQDKGDAPDAEKLYAQRVLKFAKGMPPMGPVVLTGATDVQGNRLEWAVWGWSEGMTRWLIDWGVIEGDPTDPETWVRHDAVIEKAVYQVGGGQKLRPDAWAVDSGYQSQAVYNYSRARPGVFAVDGRDGRTHPFIGAPVKVDVTWAGKRVPKGAVLWPVGTFGLKSDLYSGIRKTIAGPDENGAWRRGAMILPGDVSLAYAEQLTSEYLKAVEKRSGVKEYKWDKLEGRPNEALDIAGYARAMAYHLGLDRLSDEDWAQLRIERCGVPGEDQSDQGDLFAVQIDAPSKEATDAAQPAQPKQKQANRRSKGGDDWLGGRGTKWR